MNNGVADTAARERKLVELYQELTGASESTARAVYMHVCCGEDGDASLNGAEEPSVTPKSRHETERMGRSVGKVEPWAAIVPVPTAG